MNGTLYIKLANNRKAFVEFKSHYDGQTDYEVGLCYSKLPSVRVRWKLNQPATCPFASEAGMTEGEAVFLARSFCEAKHQEYLEWTKAKGYPIKEQTRGLNVG